MKSLIALVLLVAGVCADPVTDSIIDRVENLSLRIRERGLDPMHIRRETREYALPVPEIAQAVGIAEELHFRGLSNIQINALSYDASSSVVTFDFGIPYIHLSAEFVRVEAKLFDNLYTGEISGSLDIGPVSLKGQVDITVGVYDIIANNANVQASFGTIQSAIRIVTEKRDLTEYINLLLNTRLPEALNNFRNEVNELVGIYIVRYINRPQDA